MFQKKTTPNQIKKNTVIYSLALLATTTLYSCSNTKFTAIPTETSLADPAPLGEKGEVQEVFKLSDSQQTLQQDSLDQNVTTVSFQIKKADGSLVQSLNPSDMSIIENAINIPHFTLSKNTLEFKQTVDIVFAVDVTGSMTSTIESAKLRLTNFVRSSRSAGYHTRMCLITFGDYTVQKCDKFYDNNPTDASTLTQVEELISEITKLKALKGAQDPGGKDLNENPMRALIDAANAPWIPNDQRFLILITDDGFLYSPGNSGAVGSLAPMYTEVKDALSKSQMKVFAATPSLAGYNSNFKGQPSIVSLSQGQWFNFTDMISGKITLDTILNQILSQVNTTFVAQYTVDEIPGLDASLPLIKRNVSINLVNAAAGTVQSLQLKSNLPSGRENYKKIFKLSSKKIKKSSVVVTVNGQVLSSGYLITDSGEINFDSAPAPAALIKVVYRHEKIIDALSVKPVVLGLNIDLSTVTVLFNGLKANSADYVIEKTIEGRLALSLTDSAMSDTDPYGIIAHGELDVDVSYTK